MCARLLFTGSCVVWLIGTAVGDCQLPPHPSHGSHQPQGGDCGGADQPHACDGTPGTPAPEDWLLTVRCEPGYQHADPSAADVPSVCTHGKWSIPQLPPCVLPNLLLNDRERCTVLKPPANSQYRLLAEECGGDNLIPGAAVPHDCILFLTCNPGYRRKNGNGDFLTHCSNKTWNPHMPDDLCIRDVGRPTKPIVPPTQESTDLPVSPPTTGCVLPAASDTRRFCSLNAGCEDCDFYNRRCQISSGSRSERIVKVVCAPGHVTQTRDIAVCQDHGWNPSLSNCIKLCPPLVSEELLLKCRYGTDPLPCDKAAQPGTTVSLECLPSFLEFPDLKRIGAYRNIITCLQSGSWSSRLPPCKPGCGVSKEVTKFSATIVDGDDAHIGFFPWHAGLYYRSEDDGKTIWDQKCGGSLISNRVVLTAAHCVINTVARDLRIALGKFYRSWDTKEPTEVKRNVSEISVAPEYNRLIYSFDIALVLLSEKITLGQYIMPVCRDFDDGLYRLQSSKLYVVGWGKTSNSGPSSENLLYNTVTKMTDKDCQNALPTYYTAFEKFCAVKNNSESVIQKGDSGGGLTAVYEDGLHYIIGIISTKIRPFVASGPTVEVSMFTNIKWKSHTEWIDNKITHFQNTYGS